MALVAAMPSVPGIRMSMRATSGCSARASSTARRPSAASPARASAADELFGANAMDLSLRPAAARAGHDQELALADRLSAFWR
ncbi:hypothetical protein GCM10025864_33870 [Luteimicrobium album]|uniref:Uncharacterized protein n=1 Tax=Luteimicrobium album TaxID=1054550 RepID=A0ABQ6I6N8_9MICO|nr:hypothetical protein GCM10025864_33870 [Luteimicrobium album]